MATTTEEFINLIEQSLTIAEQMRSQSEASERLNNVVTALHHLRTKVTIGQLESSDGYSTLGLAREVADWIEPLDAPLLKAVGAVEAYYQQHF